MTSGGGFGGTQSSGGSGVSQYSTVRMNDLTMHTHIFTFHAYMDIFDPGIYLPSRRWRKHAKISRLVMQHRPVDRVWRRRRRGQGVPGLRDSGVGEPMDGGHKGLGNGGPDGVALVGRLHNELWAAYRKSHLCRPRRSGIRRDTYCILR